MEERSRKKLTAIFVSVAILVAFAVLVSCRVAELSNGGTAANANARDLSQAEKLIVGSDTSYPPFEYLNQEGNADGFDIEVIGEIGNRLAKEIEIKSVSYDSLYQQLIEGDIDMAISALPVLEDKKTVVDYSQPYYTLEYLLLGLSDTEIKLKEDLDSQDVGMLKIARENLPPEVIARYRDAEYDDIKVMLEDLKAKEIEGVIIAKPIAINMLKQDIKIYRVLETIKSNRDFVIAIRKNSQIKQDIDQIIAEMVEDGTMAEIYNNWFLLE
ncbi:MAG: ABC transporter substrate-binding protein [Actinomycetota bacterium]|nr:ABC transporter substrate-binding protein [Actinomycetota bacterium]